MVTLPTTRFNTKKFYTVLTLCFARICEQTATVPCTVLTDWVCIAEVVFTARYGLSSGIKQRRFFCKWIRILVLPSQEGTTEQTHKQCTCIKIEKFCIINFSNRDLKWRQSTFGHDILFAGHLNFLAKFTKAVNIT